MKKIFLIFTTICCLSSLATVPEPIFVSFKGTKCKLTKENKEYLDIEISETIASLKERKHDLTFDIKVSYAYNVLNEKNTYLSCFKKSILVLNYIV